MEKAGSLDHRIVKEFEALLRERRARLQEYVRARMTERRTGEPHRSPEDATNAVESLSEDLEVAMLDREIREAAQIDAALERLARDEYGICGNCGTVIGLGRLRADGGGPPRADGLPEPHTLLQEEGFELLHDPMIERVCPLHSVLALSRRYSLGRRAPTSDSSG